MPVDTVVAVEIWSTTGKIARINLLRLGIEKMCLDEYVSTLVHDVLLMFHHSALVQTRSSSTLGKIQLSEMCELSLFDDDNKIPP